MDYAANYNKLIKYGTCSDLLKSTIKITDLYFLILWVAGVENKF